MLWWAFSRSVFASIIFWGQVDIHPWASPSGCSLFPHSIGRAFLPVGFPGVVGLGQRQVCHQLWQKVHRWGDCPCGDPSCWWGGEGSWEWQPSFTTLTRQKWSLQYLFWPYSNGTHLSWAWWWWRSSPTHPMSPGGHDRDSVVGVSENNTDQSGDESESNQESWESIADSNLESVTGECLTCSDTEEAAVKSTCQKFHKKVWALCRLTRQSLWTVSQMVLIGKSHQAVWGSDQHCQRRVGPCSQGRLWLLQDGQDGSPDWLTALNQRGHRYKKISS